MEDDKGTNAIFDKLAAFLNKYSNIQIFTILYLSKVLIYLLLISFLMLLGANLEFSDLHITPMLLYQKVLFPSLVETLIFQVLIIEFLTRVKLNKNWIIVISGLSFALAHYQNLIYIIYEIPFGFFYAIAYLIFRQRTRGQILLPFILVFLMHFLWNLTILFT